MTDTKPGKTLTLKKKPATADSAPAGDGERRKRSGARARQVEQLEREREKQRQALAPAPAARPEASSAPAEAPPRRTGKPRSASPAPIAARQRSEEHTSELQSLMRISYAVFCLNKKISTCPQTSQLLTY